ncbi:aldehyde dehydrogenase family protein [Streptomyces sp. NPDC048171]|uniref:aldehyde dehydrogenase family protein n=1 Tax=Streptomyces sp. NPDC048171 TaxID=3365504 RepID=UPI00371C8569
MSAAGRPVLDPATGRTVTHVPDTDASGVADAVARAEAAFHGGWADTSPARRGGLLRELAKLLRQDRDELAALERRDAGKPTRRALGEVDFAAEVADWFAAAARYPVGESHPAGPGMRTYTDRMPVGVCAAVVPNNYWVNTWGDTEETVSVSGLGQSGYGRELGIHAVEGCTRPRAVWIAHRPGR